MFVKTESGTHPYTIVPGLALGLHGPYTHSVADSSRSLRRETWNSLCEDPNLKRSEERVQLQLFDFNLVQTFIR